MAESSIVVCAAEVVRGIGVDGTDDISGIAVVEAEVVPGVGAADSLLPGSLASLGAPVEPESVGTPLAPESVAAAAVALGESGLVVPPGLPDADSLGLPESPSVAPAGVAEF